MDSIPVLYQDIQTKKAKTGRWVGISPTGWYAVDILDANHTITYVQSIVPYNVEFINRPWWEVQAKSVVHVIAQSEG